MKSPLWIWYICALVVITARAQVPNFDYYSFIANHDGYIIEDNEYTCPCFGDWDGDGDLDMMVGVLYYGNIYYYENLSATVQPTFAPAQLLYADGSPIFLNGT